MADPSLIINELKFALRERGLTYAAVVSDTALLQLKAALRQTARQCADIIERDRAPQERRHGAAFVLALRPWSFSGFSQLERPAARGATRG